MGQKRAFQGTGTALVTPFKKNGSLDEKSLRNLVEFQIKGGVQALIPVGTTGESATLSYKEHYRVFDVVIEQANGRVKIFAGTGSNNTAEAIEQSRQAKKAGADAVLVIGPYYNKPSQEGYFQHYRKIAETVDIPIIVYNVPGRTGGNIEASTTLRMAAEIPHVIAVKEASGNMAQVMEIARNKPAGLSLLSGDDALTLPMMALGGDGCISVVTNEVPRDFSDLVTHCLRGRWDKARALHNKLLPLMNANFIEANPIPVKAALAMMGMIEEVYRLPLVPLAEKNREKLRSVMTELKLI
ncbi:MAG TPA: 4-hydroxy-tetrahydrodipicolinate synthase [Bacteroidetes bacterium]|nr:MAG: 4-hydroxy-tetrahydrodipicolinate synthase [Ignavibacteria bacterium GWA2_54_16]HCA79734.1 4-hydroxy-tetrahydrodipicolinate synthase [Bacteroidota bacterium]